MYKLHLGNVLSCIFRILEVINQGVEPGSFSGHHITRRITPVDEKESEEVDEIEPYLCRLKR